MAAGHDRYQRGCERLARVCEGVWKGESGN